MDYGNPVQWGRINPVAKEYERSVGLFDMLVIVLVLVIRRYRILGWLRSIWDDWYECGSGSFVCSWKSLALGRWLFVLIFLLLYCDLLTILNNVMVRSAQSC